jgi:hypothetical protein
MGLIPIEDRLGGMTSLVYPLFEMTHCREPRSASLPETGSTGPWRLRLFTELAGRGILSQSFDCMGGGLGEADGLDNSGARI